MNLTIIYQGKANDKNKINLFREDEIRIRENNNLPKGAEGRKIYLVMIIRIIIFQIEENKNKKDNIWGKEDNKEERNSKRPKNRK